MPDLLLQMTLSTVNFGTRHAVWKLLPRIHTKEVMKMKQFVEPTIEYEEFEPVDVLTVSGFGDPELPPDPF